MTTEQQCRTTTHPLDMLPLFRRWRPSPARDVLYTAIWNVLMAFVLVAASRQLNDRASSFWDDLYPSLIISNMVGFMIHGALVAGDRLLRGWPARAPRLARVVYYLALVSTCVILGIASGTALLKGVNPLLYLTDATALASLLRFALVISVIMFVIFMAGERRAASETLAARQNEQIAQAARLLAEARLRGLQAQIEPHFLYNTLANVVGLIDTQPAQARHMLERFIAYLRASLSASRAEVSTLGTELDLAAAYLDVLAVRMGPRLRYRIEADDACRAQPIAPMLLQPVVENAVTHGLEPTIEGGEIVVRAALDEHHLRIEVADTGAGLTDAPPRPGGGIGLQNLRERLRTLHGPGAQVQFIENQPAGITARILIPSKVSP